jgi:hypothetical protein
VVATAKRRRFSASEKRQILAEADACKKPGELGALLRRKTLLAALNSERFADMAPRAIYAMLLDEGQYLASVRTMYCVLAAEGQSLERRRQWTHPPYAKPELLAVAPRRHSRGVVFLASTVGRNRLTRL